MSNGKATPAGKATLTYENHSIDLPAFAGTLGPHVVDIRKLYDAAVKGDANSPLYSMNTQPFEAELGSVIKLAFSRTVLWLHIPIVLFVLALSSYPLFHICRQKAVSHPAQSAMSGTKPSFQLINFAASESICTATVWSIRSGTRNTSAIMRASGH